MRFPLRRPSGLLVLLLSLTATLSGCSFVFTEGPPPPQERARHPDFDCSSGYGWPALDTGIVVLEGGFLAIRGTGAIASGSKGILVDFVTVAVFAFSAIHGYGTVYKCRDAIEEAEATPDLPHHHRPPPPRPAPPPPRPEPAQAGDAADSP